MGLTIHFDIEAEPKDEKAAIALVRDMRKLATKLPFKEVGNQYILRGDACDPSRYHDQEDRGGPRAGILPILSESVWLPWSARKGPGRRTVDVLPDCVTGFLVWPGIGAESCVIRLARYPKTIDAIYRNRDDRRFLDAAGDYDWAKERRYHRRLSASTLIARQSQLRTIAVPRSAVWRGSDFCKTEYAVNPECGGYANFLACHVMLFTLLAGIAKLPGVKARVVDEGHYGPANYAADHGEAVAAGRRPTYRMHPPTYSVMALLRQLAGSAADKVAASLVADVAALAPNPCSYDWRNRSFKLAKLETVVGFIGDMQAVAYRRRVAEAPTR